MIAGPRGTSIYREEVKGQRSGGAIREARAVTEERLHIRDEVVAEHVIYYMRESRHDVRAVDGLARHLRTRTRDQSRLCTLAPRRLHRGAPSGKGRHQQGRLTSMPLATLKSSRSTWNLRICIHSSLLLGYIWRSCRLAISTAHPMVARNKGHLRALITVDASLPARDASCKPPATTSRQAYPRQVVQSSEEAQRTLVPPSWLLTRVLVRFTRGNRRQLRTTSQARGLSIMDWQLH